MELKKTFATDKEAELSGKWFPLGEGGEVKVARANTTRYREIFRKHIEPYRTAVDMGTMSEEEGEKILVEVLAEAVLLDWKGFTDNGEEVPYSKEKAQEYMLEYPDFRTMIQSFADNMASFRAQMMEQEMGNLSSESSGTPSGQDERVSL